MALWSFIILPSFFFLLTSHAKHKYMTKYLKIKKNLEQTISTSTQIKINKLAFQVTSDQSQYMFEMMVN